VSVPAALIVQQILRQFVNLQAEVGSVGAFVTAIGTLYSVLTGFTVISVWQQFTDTDRAVKREARGWQSCGVTWVMSTTRRVSPRPERDRALPGRGRG